MKDKLAEHGIMVSRYGSSKIHCPKCSDQRKNKVDRCLSVLLNTDEAKWNCHHCGYKGIVNDKSEAPGAPYSKGNRSRDSQQAWRDKCKQSF